MVSVVVRRGTLDDAEWILEELPAFSDFAGTKFPLFEDPAHVRRMLHAVIQDHLVFVATRGQERLGFIAGIAQQHPFNPRIRVLTEQLWWVPQQHRGSRAGAMLFQAFVEWGENNVDWISFGLEAHSPVRDAVFTRRGFRLQERVFLKEVH